MGKPDSSELTTHLRTVHFSLVLVCVLVGISLHGYSLSEPSAIYRQFESISRIKVDWNSWTKGFGTEQIKWLQDQGLGWPEKIPGELYFPPEELTRENLPQRDNGWLARPSYIPIYLYLSVNLPSGSRHEILGRGWPREDETEFLPGGLDAVGNPQLDTIEEFRQFWNASDEVVAFVVKDISEVAYIASDGGVRAELRWIPRPTLPNTVKLKLGRMDIGLREGGDYCKGFKEILTSRWSLQFNVLFCGKVPLRPNEQSAQILVLPARYKKQPVPVNLRIWLADRFKFSAKGGKFEDTFPELYELMKTDRQMRFEDVERHLQSELQHQRSSEKVEVLGLKFREGDLATWGAIFIVVVQIYFVIHLRELSKRLQATDEIPKVAWIGLYPDCIARTVSLFTASLLPVLVLIYGSVQLGYSWLMIVLLTFGVGSAIKTVMLLSRFQRDRKG